MLLKNQFHVSEKKSSFCPHYFACINFSVLIWFAHGRGISKPEECTRAVSAKRKIQNLFRVFRASALSLTSTQPEFASRAAGSVPAFGEA
jgi:hypothetical protein